MRLFRMHLAAIVGGAAALMLLAVLNGAPFVFWDTALYLGLGDLLTAPEPLARIAPLLNNPDLLHLDAAGRNERLGAAASHLGARSVFYSLFSFLAMSWLTLWGAAFLQCLLVAGGLWRLLRLCAAEALTPLRFIALCMGLAVLTPLGVFAATILPDIAAGALLLFLVIQFVFWRRLGGWERAVTAVLTALCVLAHPANVAIAIGAGVLLAAFAWLRAGSLGSGAAPLGALALTLAASTLVNAALVAAASSHLGHALTRPPMLAGRVIDDGPGRLLLAERCSERYAICAFADRILSHPRHGGDHVMWRRDAETGGVYQLVPLDVRARLRAEELPFILDAVSHDPIGQIAASARNIFELSYSFKAEGAGTVFSFTFDDYREAVDYIGAPLILEHLPNREACARDPARVCGAVPLRALRAPHYLSMALAALLALALLLARLRTTGPRLARIDDWEAALLGAALAVLANIVICAVLAGPYDRYNARVIWIFPALVGAIALAAPQKLAALPRLLLRAHTQA